MGPPQLSITSVLGFLRDPWGCPGVEESQMNHGMFKETLQYDLVKLQPHRDTRMEAEAQRGTGACPRSYSWLATEVGCPGSC